MQLPGTIEQAVYHARFRLLMGAADVAAFALLWWIAVRRRPDAVGIVVGTYVAITIVLEFVLYDRLDLLMLALVLGALAAWLRADESYRPRRWKTLAYGLVGLGASYKLFPIVILPFFVIADWHAERRAMPVATRTAVCLGVLLLPFAVMYPSAGATTAGFLGYHATRGVEIGSTWSTLMWLVSRNDPSLAITAGFGSWELAGQFSVVFARAASIALIVWLAGSGAWALALWNSFEATRAYPQALVAITGLLVVLDVLSVQYLLWALPLVMLMALEVAERTTTIAIIAAVCLVIAVLTTVFYPLSMRYVVPLNPWVMSTLAVRNVLYVCVFGWLVYRAVSLDARRRSQSRPPSHV